jgi:cytochrome P450
VVTGYDPYDWAVQDNPYPAYAWLREHAPVYRHEQRDFWALSRHEDVLAALADPALFSSASGVTLEPSSRGPQARAVMFFLAMDAPEHTRMRGLVAAAFTPRRAAALGPRIRELARGRLEPLLDRRAFDFITEFAALLPVDVICELTGVPAADRAQVHAAAGQMIHRDDGTRR